MVDSAAVGRVIAHGASTAQAASHTEGGPRPLSLWTDAGNSVSSWAHNLNFAKATVAGLTEKKWSSTALADIPGSVEARADGIVDAAKGVADAAKNIANAEGALAKAKGVLATVGATFETLTAVEQLLSVPFSAIPFPAMPAARIFDMAVGIPHAHLHPPNLVPPAPIFPLPSLGPILPIPYVSGAEKVLINGVPAARCGDIGASIWCGGYFPFYEIYLGSSNVWIQGQRAARFGVDVTKHCIFSTPKPKDLPVGCAIGAITMGSPNVIIGGMPLPSFSAYAIGKAFGFIGKKIGNKVRAARAAAAVKKVAQNAARGAAGKGVFAGFANIFRKVRAAFAFNNKAAQQAVAKQQAFAKKAVGLQAMHKANPGAVFKSQDGAAKAAMEAIHPDSIAHNSEFGGLIYRDAHGNYGYTNPGAGTGAGVHVAQTPVPSGATEVGYYHSHGDYSTMNRTTKQPVRTSNPKKDSYNSDNFSPKDKNLAKSRAQGDPIYQAYVVTPGGDMKVYDWQTRKVSDL